MRFLLSMLVTLAVALQSAAGFLDGEGDLANSGWTLLQDNPDDDLSVSKGVLSMSCSYAPYQGKVYGRRIDFPAQGHLDVEVQLRATGGGSDGVCVLLQIGEMIVCFRGDHAARYLPNRKPDTVNVGEHRMKLGEWTPLRVVWDTPARELRYYVGDLRVPSFVETDVLSPGAVPNECWLKIGNYGIDRAPQIHRFRDLRVEAGLPEQDGGDRPAALVFCGLGSEFWPIGDWTKGYADEDVYRFYLLFNNSEPLPVNHMLLSAVPDAALVRRAGLIVLSDFPLKESVLPYALQERLLAAVERGARLVVTGGLTGLQHGGGFDSPIAKALPVELVSPWQDPPVDGKVVVRRGEGAICVLKSNQPNKKEESK